MWVSSKLSNVFFGFFPYFAIWAYQSYDIEVHLTHWNVVCRYEYLHVRKLHISHRQRYNKMHNRPSKGATVSFHTNFLQKGIRRSWSRYLWLQKFSCYPPDWVLINPERPGVLATLLWILLSHADKYFQLLT